MPKNDDPTHRRQAEEAAERDRQVMALIREGSTQAEVSRMLGVSRQRISQIVARAKARDRSVR